MSLGKPDLEGNVLRVYGIAAPEKDNKGSFQPNGGGFGA